MKTQYNNVTRLSGPGGHQPSNNETITISIFHKFQHSPFPESRNCWDYQVYFIFSFPLCFWWLVTFIPKTLTSQRTRWTTQLLWVSAQQQTATFYDMNNNIISGFKTARNVTQTITRGRHGESWGEEGNIECVISITWMGILELMLCHLWTCLLVTLPPSSACSLVGKLSYCCQCRAVLLESV